MSALIKILTFVYIFIFAGVIVLADARGTNYFSFIARIPFGDKIGHFCLMGMLAFVVNLTLRVKTVRVGERAILLGSLVVATIVFAEEVSQIFVSGRTFDVTDLFFDLAGIAFFDEMARLIYRKSMLN